ncbi:MULTISPECIES: S1 RNA-binding domain-containing protein [unclassified Mycoplasma]|uniref:S1 RNA-binding domain-containing protein n=1 Tax=unclassified Mycoplasma TaxID=2683645 RepID=UPI000FDD3B51
MKQTTETEIRAHSIVTGKVTSLWKTYLEVELTDGCRGLLHISQVSDYYVYRLDKMFKVGNEYDFYVLGVDPKSQKLALSWKKIVPVFLRNPFEFKIAPTRHGFSNLKKFVRGLIND